MLSIPANLYGGPGGTVQVPVNIDNPNPVGSGGLTHAVLAIQFSTSYFTVANSDVAIGSLTGGWTLTPNVDSAAGQIGIVLDSGGSPIASTSGGSVVVITLHVNANAPAVTTSINLEANNAPNGATFTTALTGATTAIGLNPPPTNASNDVGVDGAVNVILWTSSPPSQPGSFTPALIKSAYGFDQLSFALGGTTFSEANNNLGAGTTIAIVDPFQNPNIANDLVQFDSAFNLPNSTLTIVSPPGSSAANAPANSSYSLETAIDVEWCMPSLPAQHSPRRSRGCRRSHAVRRCRIRGQAAGCCGGFHELVPAG